MSKKKLEIKSLNIYCPKLNQIVEIDNSLISWHGSSQDCEMCGSHSIITIYFLCKCGNHHDIVVCET